MEKLNDKQINVLRWWYSNRNYHAGLILLSRFSKNKVLLHTLMKPGKENIPAMQNKLSYELPKSVGLDWTNMPQLPEPANELPDTKDEERITEDVFHEIQEIKQYITEENPEQYPPIIIKIKYAYADLYKQRSLKHKEMRNIPHLNTEENTSKRAILLDLIKHFSAEMDHLFRFIGDYDANKTIPLHEIVWPPEPKNISQELPDNVKALRKMKKNHQSSNSRDHNLLNYQNKTKLDEFILMAKGPKRMKIEYRIKQRNKLIEQIDSKIIQLEHAD